MKGAFYDVLNINYNGAAIGSPWGARSVNGFVEGWFAYENENKKNLVACSCSAKGEIIISNSVTSIADWAFADCYDLTSIKIPNSVTKIGDDAFDGCTSLTFIEIPNSVTNIGEYAFYGCSDLTSVIIGNKVSTIYGNTFSSCKRLQNITFGSSVKVIETNAFNNSCSIQTITCYSMRPPTVQDNAFPCGLPYSTIIYVPADYLNNYVMHDFWGVYDVRPLGATSVQTSDIQVTPTENTANVIWPSVSGAVTYELVIKDKDGNVICTLVFNENGQLTSIAFSAPSRDNAPRQTQAAGFSFTVTGLEQGSTYDLTITAKDNNGTTIDKKEISFTTIGQSMAFDEIANPKSSNGKLLIDGQLYILRDGKMYNVQGQEIK